MTSNLFRGVKKRLKNRKMNQLMQWRYGSQPQSFDFQADFARGGTPVDEAFAQRVLTGTKRRMSEMPTDQWNQIFHTFHADIRQAVEADDVDRIRTILDNPVQSDLFYGFEALSKTLRQGGLRAEDIHCPTLAFDGFLRLSEALGARRIDNPERFKRKPKTRRIDDVIDEIEDALQVELSFPNDFPEEYGLVTKRGIATERVPQAIHQAWTVAQLGGSVVEIGGGQGRVAYFARLLGVTDYTIVDIPVTAMAQAAFLHKAGLPISLDHEEAADGAIRLMSPETFFKCDRNYDVVLNSDSLTELGHELGTAYAGKIAECATTFVSINHESNADTVLQLMTETGRVKTRTRHPSWMRRGYAEEVFTFNR